MFEGTEHTRLRRRGRALTGIAACLALVAASCSSDDDDADDAPVSTDAAVTEPTEADEPDTSEPDTSEPVTTEADEPDTTEPVTTEADGEGDDTGGDDPAAVFPSLDPPTGEPMLVGLVNTEGTPGLDFPDIRLAIEGAVDYLNQHGGFGGRPIELQVCVAAGSPETSQACAQELTGNDVELVMLGLDLFPDYATYTAAGVPVLGVLPILPGDYTANARFLTGGNATVMAAAAGVAQEHFGAQSVGIVSADNPGSNSSRDSLIASLDQLGISYTAVSGGDNETDAGFLGLVQQAAAGDPDVIVSLYDNAGCVGMMRGRVSLGIDTPVITTGICASGDVIDQVGDDAIGWTFLGVATQEDDEPARILREIMAPVLDVAPEEVDSTSLGLGGLGLSMVMSLAVYSNRLADEGTEVTGSALYELVDTGEGLTFWPGGAPVECGAAPDYPAICAFTFPVSEYLPGGEVRTIPGFDAFSALEYLP